MNYLKAIGRRVSLGILACTLLPILLTAATFNNPIIPGFHPDPSICQVGSDFYLVNSSFEYFPGIPIYHSQDLVHWELIGNALTTNTQLPLQGQPSSGGLFAATIRYNNGIYYIVCDNTGGGGNFIVTATNPAGPWSNPTWLNDFDMDPDLFWDTNGTVYFDRYGYSGIAQAVLNSSLTAFTTPFSYVWDDTSEPWNEGPHLYLINGTYYLMCAEGGTGTGHMEKIGRGSSPTGPFTACPYNPILTESDQPDSPLQCTGHGDMVQLADGTWWMIFLGVRPQTPNNVNGTSVLGRETCLAPVTWTADGWPVVNGTHNVSLTMTAPNLPTVQFTPIPAVHTFSSAGLSPEWIHVRNPNPGDYSLTARPGWLRIIGNPGSLTETVSPAFAGIRQGGFTMTATTLLQFNPGTSGEEAGMCVRASDTYNFEFGLMNVNGTQQVFARTVQNGATLILASAPWSGGQIYLQLGCLDDRYQMAYSTDNSTWNQLAVVPATDYSMETAGTFTGAVIGLYGTGNGSTCVDPADFSYLDWELDEAQNLQPITTPPTPTPTPVATVPACGNSTYLSIDCGSTTSYLDSTNVTWLPDYGYNSDSSTYGSGNAIANTSDQTLYQTNRYGSANGLTYTVSLPDGTYLVKILEAELFFSSAGQRVFNITCQGNTVATNYDIVAAAGGAYRATSLTFTASVTTGTLTLAAQATTNFAQFSGIQFTWLGAPCGSSPTITPTPSRSPTLTATTSATATLTPSLTYTLTATETATPSVTATSSSTATPTGTPTNSPTVTPSATPTNTPTATSSDTLTNTATFTPSITRTNTPTATPSSTLTNTGTVTSTPSLSVTGTPTFSAIPSATATESPTGSANPISSDTGTSIPTLSVTGTQSPSPSETPTPVLTLNGSPSATPSVGGTPTLTQTPMVTSTTVPTPASGPVKIVKVVPVPNPNPLNLAVELDGETPGLTIQIYTEGMTLAGEWTTPAEGPGWVRIAIPAQTFSQTAGGTYYYRVSAVNSKGKAAVGCLVLLR